MGAYAQHLHKVLTKYRPQETEDVQGFLEDIRKLVVLAKDEFRNDQKRGNFTDKTGDEFLRNCKMSLAIPRSYSEGKFE